MCLRKEYFFVCEKNSEFFNAEPGGRNWGL
jgi:hypothetical protein